MIFHSPPKGKGKENKGHATSGKAGSTPKAQVLAASLSLRVHDLEDTQQQQQELLEQLQSQQRQLSQQGLRTDLKGTVAALDIELGRVRHEHVQLEAQVSTATATLDTLGDAVFKELPGVQEQQQQQLKTHGTVLEDVQRLLQQVQQQALHARQVQVEVKASC